MENLYASSQCKLWGVTFSRSPGLLLDFFSGAGTLWRSCNGGNGWLELLWMNTLYCSSSVLGGWGCWAGPCGDSPGVRSSVWFPCSGPFFVVVNLKLSFLSRIHPHVSPCSSKMGVCYDFCFESWHYPYWSRLRGWIRHSEISNPGCQS